MTWAHTHCLVTQVSTERRCKHTLIAYWPTEYRKAMWPHIRCLLTQWEQNGMWAHSFTDPVGTGMGCEHSVFTDTLSTGMGFEHTQCLMTKWVQEGDVSTLIVYWLHEYRKVMWAHTHCFTDQVSTGMRCERPGRSQSSFAGYASPPAVAGSWRPLDCPG